jgi:Mg2+-importing ATPase
MVPVGPVSSIFDHSTSLFMWSICHANSPVKPFLFQPARFVEGLLSQTLIVHVVRTRLLPFVESCASTAWMVTPFAAMVAGLVIRFPRLRASLAMRPLRAAYFRRLLLILAACCGLAQLVKH